MQSIAGRLEEVVDRDDDTENPFYARLHQDGTLLSIVE